MQSNIPEKLQESQVIPKPSSDEMEKSLPSEQKNTGPVSGFSIIPRPIQQESLNFEVTHSIKQSAEIEPQEKKVLTVGNEGKEITPPEVELKKVSDNHNEASEDKIITHTAIEYKSALNTSSDVTNNNSGNIIPRPNLPIISEMSVIKSPMEVDSKKIENGNSPGEEIHLNAAEGAAPLKSEIKNNEKIKPIEIVEDTDQNDFNGEINLDNNPSDQPVGSDPETQQQFGKCYLHTE